MKFATKREGELFARMETNQTHRKHKARPARWQGPDLVWHDCWTVVLVTKRR
jgi:hypothetical protein